MDKVKIMQVNVGEAPKFVEVEGGLENYQAIVDGWLEVLRLPYGIDLWVNEEGLLLDLPTNFTIARLGENTIRPVQSIAGNVFFASSDDEGNTVSLSEYQQYLLEVMFDFNREVLVIG